MTRYLIFVCALANATAATAQSLSATRHYQPGINATHYELTVVIPDTGRRIEVTATIHLRPVLQPTRGSDSVWFDLERPMQVRSVSVNGRETTFARDDHTVRVAFPRVDASCSMVSSTGGDVRRCTNLVTIEAAGEPTDGLIISQDSAGRWLYFSDHWPNRARHWIPSIDHPSDKATVEWRVHAPSALKVVANGRMAEESPLPNLPGRSITVWRTDRPLPPYLMAVAVAPLARVDLGATACRFAEGGGCVQQDVYEAPELAPRTPPGFASAAAIVEWMGRWVAPFPYEKLSHLQSSTRFGGMENASAIFYASGQFKSMTLGQGLVAHETAHQWFGDAVTPARWADLWLSEGFATYFAALWNIESARVAGRANGDSAFRGALAGIKRTVLGVAVVKERPVIDTTQNDLLALLNANSYQKGGFVLHMLRRQIGDSAWIRGVRAYYAAHRHGNAMTDDLRRAMETASGSDLRWFFTQWLTRPGYAELDISWEHTDGVSVRIQQTGRFGSYRLLLPVEIEDANGVVTRATLDVPSTSTAQLRLSGRFAQRPRRVTFDPDGDVLAVITAR